MKKVTVKQKLLSLQRTTVAALNHSAPAQRMQDTTSSKAPDTTCSKAQDTYQTR